MNNIFLLNDYITNGYRLEFVDFIYIISILFGIFTIISRNPIVSVLFLIGLFVNIAGLLILVGYDYIGLSYILVYVGAVSILFLFILMLINIRISELVSETNNDIPLAVITVLLFYFIIGQVIPSNLTDNTIVTSLSNSFSEVYNVQLDNEILNIIDLKQEIAYASSKSWDNSLIEFTHITGIGNIMYTNYSLWLIISSVILLVGMVGAIVITIKQK
ncbi:NADH dehydrogenase subunit 6 (mitochondrion) [Aspergillus luchuensis]|uniref:NADH-ubiquinone oxidoreductase chain 6 n=4 Tax=Aspergillus subgen. Circumdati TaxID=2720871 RepID=A0A3G5AVQ1_ASPKA|nr:NADH dehydrogenase subunit 6 [Aspergillus luchuensis]QVL28846.1 Nad6 [Aspergillus niger]BAL04879.1 NADH dehydrogenase subunit 6 [Aspergillus luchuensis IFO 4308]BCD83302.1 NADH dehydrogenase subunit 6 [Aspergillus tubingensis]AYV91262.1 NADH dehydrogenase subunit 6 [Aspergillus luchuensis]BCS05610.1 NADH dehydrogenase subunit 6 [Aspergillus luchuensis]